MILKPVEVMLIMTPISRRLNRKPKQSWPTNVFSPGLSAAFALDRTKVSDNNAAYLHHCSSDAETGHNQMSPCNEQGINQILRRTRHYHRDTVLKRLRHYLFKTVR